MGNPALTDTQARKVIAWGQQGRTADDIAKELGCAPLVVKRIISGESYRHLSVGAHTKRCECGSCVQDRRREQNITIGENAVLTGVCMQCGKPARVTAPKLLGRPGAVLCGEHSRPGGK